MSTPKRGMSGKPPTTPPRGTELLETASPILRGEIWQIDFDPAQGSEANKRRPAVVVSNDRANATATRLGRGVVTVVPVTSNTDNVGRIWCVAANY